jgi:hypothetical protein
MDRRDFLRLAGVGTGTLAAAGRAAANHEDGTDPQPADGTEAYESKTRTLKYPLAGVPAVLERGDTLRLELDAADPGDVTAT